MSAIPTPDTAPSPAAPSGVAPSATAAEQARRRVSIDPILVATAGDEAADAAIGLARLLAGSTAADVRMVSVVEPMMLPDAGTVWMPAPPGFGAELLAERQAAVDAQLARAGVAESGWPVDIVVGDPARQIAARARVARARLLMLGRAADGPVRRFFGGALAQRLLRLADVPVLSVMPALTTLPGRVVLAVDFSPYSLYAAQVALAIAAPDAIVHLVHVRPRPVPLTAGADDWERRYAGALPAAFERFVDELNGADGHQIETVTLAGAPASALVEFAEAAGTDLVVTGAHGRGFVDRLVLGSVATGLLHRAPCSVLCVPGSAVAHAAQRRWAVAGLRTTPVPESRWNETLADLTRRAAGRPCVVEIDRPDGGAQRVAEGLPFAGADFDSHGSRVMLMLGDPSLDGRYLSHMIAGATGLAVITDDAGGVRVLRVTDADGQTLVTFGG